MNARGIILAAAGAIAWPSALALSVARVPSSVTLGAALNFPVQVQLAGDESLNSTCVTAEVYQDDRRMLPSSVRLSIESGANADERVVRIYTTTAIEEPVVSITLTLGCAVRLERRFTVFADPPLVTVATAPEASEPPVAAPPVRATRREAPASAPRADAAGASDTAPATSSTTAERAGTRPSSARATTSPRAAAASAPAAQAARRSARASAPGAAPGTTTTAAAPTPGAQAPAAPASTTEPARPRLRLDPLEPVARSGPAASTAAAVQEAQLRVAAMAASAAMAEQAASNALAQAAQAAERMRALEQGLEKLRADAERDRDQLITLRAKLAQAEGSGRLAPWLGVALALLAAVAVWLGLRMRRLQRERDAQWWAATRAAQGKGPPANPPTLQPMTLPPHMAPTTTPRPPLPAPVKPATPLKPAFRDSLFTSQQEPRDVSIEELIDLEQQAEFFVVLGQDDAAIDLLMGHIRSSGGTSPLPYLKLLEIYRRQGDRESYERTRERFNHRFNAYAPDWDSDLQHGRSLDEYAGVMQRLQARWSEPLDAMTELEALMFRRDGGELFELPAYREVLFLYSMARDLLDHQGGPPTSIDVLLPLGDKSHDFEPTTARPHLFTSATGLAELGRATDPPIAVLQPSAPLEFDDRPTGSHGGGVDLDLTGPVPMDDTVVFRRDDSPEARNPDQRSDFADLPPPPVPKRR